MALSHGSRLGTFEIRDQVGKGGMGEVYRAHDTKLGREVAIKLLPPEFAEDPERLARLEREARLLAALNHPNIATIHGLEQSDGTRFLVLEFVEGDTLADRLKRGAIPPEESLKISLQIADALEAAHEKGVIHRDLKPANIKITPEGRVKVLDFGLAKAFGDARAEEDLSNSPTLSHAATQQGVILGTAAYMSPEQAKGRKADKRADVWAFGCVLYEMLAGRPPFHGEDTTTILARVVDREPDFDVLPGNLHTKILDVLLRCLQKDIGRRYRDIADARLDLESVMADPSGVLLQPAENTSRPPWLWWAASIFGILITAVAVWMLKPSDAESPKVISFAHVLPPGRSLPGTFLGSAGAGQFEISSDGTQIVYADDQQLYLRPMDEYEAHAVPGSREIPLFPVFSPDNEHIAYWSRSEEALRKIPVTGGTPETITRVPANILGIGAIGINWDVEDRLLYATGEGIWEVSPAEREEPRLLLRAETGLVTFPRLLPERDAILYTEFRPRNGGLQASTEVLRLEDGEEPTTLLNGGGAARYVKTGHLVYVSDGAVYGRAFDAETLQFEGPATRLLDGIAGGAFAISDDASILAYAPMADATPGGPARRTLVYVNREGKEQPIAVEPGDWRRVRVSPDGTRMILWDGSSGIYLWDGDAELLRTLGTSPQVPAWVSDDELVLVQASAGPLRIYRRRLDSSELKDVVSNPEIFPRSLFQFSSYHADSNTLLVTLQTPEATEVGRLRLDENSKYERIIERPGIFSVTDAHMSPDGSHIVLVEGDPRAQIVIRQLPDVETDFVRLGNGIRPVWTTSGIYYLSLDDETIYRVPVETEPSLKRGPREPFIRTTGYFIEGLGQRNWDFAPDGRLVMIKEPDSPPDGVGEPELMRQRINVFVNWQREFVERMTQE